MKENGILKNLRETYLLAAADLELFPEGSEEYRRAEAAVMNTSRTVFELFGAAAAEDLRAAGLEKRRQVAERIRVNGTGRYNPFACPGPGQSAQAHAAYPSTHAQGKKCEQKIDNLLIILQERGLWFKIEGTILLPTLCAFWRVSLPKRQAGKKLRPCPRSAGARRAFPLSFWK